MSVKDVRYKTDLIFHIKDKQEFFSQGKCNKTIED